MKTLITGAGGFVGRHLLTHLRNNTDNFLYGTILNDGERRPELVALCPDLHILDLRDPDAVSNLIASVRPDAIYHLAGQPYVPRSFDDPWDTLDNNIHGTLNLLQAVRELKLSTRILVIGSAEVYGTVPPEQLPLTESTPFAPSSPYSVSKIGQDMLALQYHLAHGIFTIRVRPFNHIGPGQNQRFSISDWASQIAEAEAGQRESVVYVGNLSAARDFTDVRDVVRAYSALLEHGEAGQVYNVCSGTAHTMHSLLDRLISMSQVPIEVRVATERFRPVELPILMGSYARLRERTGWQPQISIEQSLRDVLDEWRQAVAARLANRIS
ncbi:MAG TPA: GDP-mannose 4,6-dehydratase [Aggregatilineales bacterium]|nr:GDP-mannose 4,6-dehydratase [Aggregatilineales bacterium]